MKKVITALLIGLSATSAMANSTDFTVTKWDGNRNVVLGHWSDHSDDTNCDIAGVEYLLRWATSSSSNKTILSTVDHGTHIDGYMKHFETALYVPYQTQVSCTK